MMLRHKLLTACVLLIVGTAYADEPQQEPEAAVEEAVPEEPTAWNGDGIKSPKTMSGMSILGNEEAPKSLVIIPWKASQMGDDISLTDTLDDRARPVDKEVFERELRYHEIRSGDAKMSL